MIPYVTVRGTWGDGKRYNQFDVSGTPWTTHMLENGCYHIGGRRPFRWTTDLEGDDREVAGANLYAYIVPPLAPEFAVPPTETHVITYSFGLDPALHAAAMGLQIRTLISVGGPVRKDMMPVAEKARANIHRWICVCSKMDWMQHFGTFFDKEWNPFRPMPAHPLANTVIELPREAAHSGAFYNPHWINRVWAGTCIPTMKQNHQPVFPSLRSIGVDSRRWRHDNRAALSGGM